MPDKSFVRIEAFSSVGRADFLVSLLSSHGIEAHVENENSYLVIPNVRGAVHEVNVVVKAEDVEEAARISADYRESLFGDPDDPPCPTCGSQNTFQRSFRNRWRCGDCGGKWKQRHKPKKKKRALGEARGPRTLPTWLWWTAWTLIFSGIALGLVVLGSIWIERIQNS